MQKGSTHGTAHWARGAKTRSPYDQSLSDHSDLAKSTVITVIRSILITIITPRVK